KWLKRLRDEDAIIHAVATRCIAQRQRLKDMFKTMYDRDLIEDIRSELSGDFREAVMACFVAPAVYDACSMKEAIYGAGTDEQALIEIMTRTNAQIRAMKDAYEDDENVASPNRKASKTLLEADIRGDTSGTFKKLLCLHVAVRKAKECKWRQFCNELDQDRPTSRLVKALTMDKMSKLAMIKKDDGSLTKDPEEVLQHMLSTFFPRVPTARPEPNHSMDGATLAAGIVTEDLIARAGGPQGGVLTPTLWNLVMDALLSDSRSDPVFKVGYADDVTAIVAGPSPSTLRDLMQSFIRKAESWANDNGLELSEPKTVAIMFTSRLRWNIRPLQLYGRDIAFAHQTRCLGVTLDHRLNWSFHSVYRLICNATRSTPFAGMGAFLNLPPLDLFVRGEAARTTRHLIDAGVKFIYMRAPAKRNLVPHSDLCLNFLNECQANRVFTDGIASTLNLRQRYSVAIDSRDNINDQWNLGELHCYTDGSKQSANTGFGVGIFLNGRVIATHAQYTGVNSSVFQNEVLAISSCTAELLATGVTAWIRTQHRSTWANRTNCRQSRGTVPQPSHQLRKLLLRLSRRDIRAATMTLSGHGCFSRHQYLQGNATNATCSFCNSGDETAEHFGGCYEINREKLEQSVEELIANDKPTGIFEVNYKKLVDGPKSPPHSSPFRFPSARDILNSIDRETSGDYKPALRSILMKIRCRPMYFAKRLRDSKKGLGKDDKTKIRVVVSRSETRTTI
uniref:Reverse transcriptase domain-containing protein n=1 Tax=Macrostomum lignano TaxID=282301 RepID=A0A1I8HDL8_9PLAT